MKRFGLIAAFAATIALAACAGIQPPDSSGSSMPSMIVWLFYGLGGSSTSPGIDQVAQRLVSIPGVQVRGPFYWDSWAGVESDVAGAPKSARKAFVQYSCGNYSGTKIAADLQDVTINAIIGVQASVYCAPVPLTPNTLAVQYTYNAECDVTLGLGCAPYQVGTGFPASRLTVINRDDSHGEADLDPDWQADAIAGIKSAMAAPLSARLKAPFGAAPRFLVLHHGQHP